MEHIAVLVASSPTSPSARRGFDLVRELAAGGHRVSLGLLEDGVLAATGRVPGVPLAECAEVLVLDRDLALRGLGGAELAPGCRRCDYGAVVQLMMAEADRTLGMF